nr:uncharacterized protein LOC109160911 [Ipomoea batatas]
MEDQIVPEGLNEWQQLDSPFFITNDCSEFPPLNHDQGSGVGDLEAMDSLLLLSSDWECLDRSSSELLATSIPQKSPSRLRNCWIEDEEEWDPILMTIAASGTVVLIYRLEG